jgi:hypothetical protein
MIYPPQQLSRQDHPAAWRLSMSLIDSIERSSSIKLLQDLENLVFHSQRVYTQPMLP